MSEFELLTIQQENNNFILSIIVAIISFLSALFVYWDYRKRKKKESAEKSIEIAKDFALNIVEPLSRIYLFFKKNKIDIIINKINFMRLESFDIKELNTLYMIDDISAYRNIINENDVNHEIRNLICDTLNRLEYQSMYISTKVADGKYIYNSLHQQFLKCISLLYFEISLINVDIKDKYYTNIIHVYNLWKNKYIKTIKKEEKIQRKRGKIQKKQEKLDQKLSLPIPKI